jgi:hypothetical protein
MRNCPREISDAAALRDWFAGADEGAHEFAVDQRRDFSDVEICLGEELLGVLCAVSAGWLDFDLFKAGAAQLHPVFRFFQRSGDAFDS